MQVDFWFEFGSTYSYPAAMRVEDVARARGIALAWKPFLLGPIFKSQGWMDSPFNVYPVKGRYMWRDLERICARQGLPLQRSTTFPRNGLLAARLAARFERVDWLPAFVRGIYSASFAENREIAEPEVVADVLRRCGQSAALVDEATKEPSKSLLRANTDRAVELGIFGAPSFLVGAEIFWGNDRLEDAFDWAAGAR